MAGFGTAPFGTSAFGAQAGPSAGSANFIAGSAAVRSVLRTTASGQVSARGGVTSGGQIRSVVFLQVNGVYRLVKLAGAV